MNFDRAPKSSFRLKIAFTIALAATCLSRAPWAAADPLTEALEEKTRSQDAFYKGLTQLPQNPTHAQLVSLHENTLAKGSVTWVKALAEASAERIRASTQAVIGVLKRSLWKVDLSKIEKAQNSSGPAKFSVPPPASNLSGSQPPSTQGEVIDGSKKPKEVIFPGVKPFQKKSRK